MDTGEDIYAIVTLLLRVRHLSDVENYYTDCENSNGYKISRYL